MSSNLLDIITRKSKSIVLEANLKYKTQGYACLPYEELIVKNESYPNNYFVVHKNMIFEQGLCDSSYDVYKFDDSGNLISKDDYPKSFFRDMVILKKI
jgi:hypothetical protein